MVKLSSLLKFLNSYLLVDTSLKLFKIDPHMANGLQIKGKDVISKIGFAVSASLKLFEKAKQADCDAIIVHHSVNLPLYNRYEAVYQKRIEYLIKHDLSLIGYHYLLDVHPEIGNNVLLLKKIGALPLRRDVGIHGAYWGWYGEMKKERYLKDVVDDLKEILSPKGSVYEFGPKEIKRVIVCSGKASPYPSQMQDLLNKRIDLYITGEVHEWVREIFREAGINFIALGHYFSETLGVKALQKKIGKEFSGVECMFLSLANKI